MPRLGDLLTIPHRLAAIERRLEDLQAALAPAGPVAWQPRSVYLGDHTVLTQLEGGIPIFVDSRGNDVAPHLMLQGIWEPNEVAAFRRLIRPGDLVLDIGAHLGVFTLVGAVATGAEGRVLAFEPNPRNAALLRRSIAVNGLGGRVTLHQAAVGAAPGDATLLVDADWSGGAFIDPGRRAAAPAHAGKERVAVELLQIDALLAEPELRLGVAKLDIEGMEGLALQGMRALLRRSPEARLVLEFAPAMLRGQGTPARLVADLLSDLGFGFWEIGAAGALSPLAHEALAGLTDGLRNIVALRGAPP